MRNMTSLQGLPEQKFVHIRSDNDQYSCKGEPREKEALDMGFVTHRQYKYSNPERDWDKLIHLPVQPNKSNTKIELFFAKYITNKHKEILFFHST